MPHPAALFLDLDGVLVDTETRTLQILHEALANLGSRCAESTVVEMFKGRNLDLCTAELDELAGVRVPVGFVASVRARFDAEMLARLEPQPGARRVLEETALPTFVVTNSDYATAMTVLTAAGLADLVPPGRLVAGQPGERSKPAPDIYLRALRKVPAPPDRCWAVEDSAVGLQAALAAGVRAIAYGSDDVTAARLLAQGVPSIKTLHALRGTRADPFVEELSLGGR